MPVLVSISRRLLNLRDIIDSRFVWLVDTEVSKTEGRVGHTTNMVIGGTVTGDSTNEWLALDQKVQNSCSIT